MKITLNHRSCSSQKRFAIRSDAFCDNVGKIILFADSVKPTCRRNDRS